VYSLIELVLLGLVIALMPLSLVAFILVLSTSRGARNGAGFIAGWVFSLVAVIAITLAFTGGDPVRQNTTPDTAASVVQLLLGLAFLAYAFRRRGRPTGDDALPAKQPGWTRRLDDMKPWGAAVLGLLLQPWGLVGAGAVVVMHADLSNAASVIGLVLFCAVASSAIVAMEVHTLRSPAEAAARLDRLRAWIDRHRDRAVTILTFVVGWWLTLEGAIRLVT
jgi:hypothetical protein